MRGLKDSQRRSADKLVRDAIVNGFRISVGSQTIVDGVRTPPASSRAWTGHRHE